MNYFNFICTLKSLRTYGLLQDVQFLEFSEQFSQLEISH